MFLKKDVAELMEVVVKRKACVSSRRLAKEVYPTGIPEGIQKALGN